MNFAELKTEFFARGFDYLEEDAASQARAERWLNAGYREILNVHAWPFLQTATVGAAGTGTVNIPDLRKLIVVSNVDGLDGLTPGIKLTHVALPDLAEEVSDFSLTGTPEFYYVVNGAEVRTYRLGGTIRADYMRRVEPMTGTDTPVFDEEYHDLIVDRAVIKAYKDSDNFEAAAALRVEYDDGVRAMAEDYQLESRDVQWLEAYGSDM